MACNSWAKRLLFILCWRGVCSTTGGRSCICHPVGLVLLTSAIASPGARSEVHWSMCSDVQFMTEPAAPAGVESLVLRLGKRSRCSAARSWAIPEAEPHGSALARWLLQSQCGAQFGLPQHQLGQCFQRMPCQWLSHWRLHSQCAVGSVPVQTVGLIARPRDWGYVGSS